MNAVLESVTLKENASSPIQLIKVQFELGSNLEQYIENCGTYFFDACLTGDKIHFEVKKGLIKMELKIIPFKQEKFDLWKSKSNISNIPWEVGFEVFNKFNSVFNKNEEYILFTKSGMFSYGANPRLVPYRSIELGLGKPRWLIC